MIKHIHHNNFSTTPFVATKSWELFNIGNEDCVLLEPLSGSSIILDTVVALDYIDYSLSQPLFNRECNIALEQQDQDQITFEEGISGSVGIFDPNTSPQNNTGTYKNLLYTQIAKAFYNTYHNPLQIFGIENIDFQLSQMNRYLADNFRMFTIPQKMFGDKLVEGTIRFYETSFDDNVDIYDDKSGNLIASRNLFSKVQEVRSLGNLVITGSVTSSYVCPSPVGGSTGIPPEPGPLAPYAAWILDYMTLALYLLAGDEPVTWSLAPLSSALPTGVSLDSGTGIVDGIPTEYGSFSIIFRATNDSGFGDVEWDLTVVDP